MPQLAHHLRRLIGLSPRRPKLKKFKPRFRSLYARVEQLEPRRLLASTIQGVLWHDGDADGEFDVGESTLAGWTVFLDQNQDGQLDVGETSVQSGAGGQYAFTGLAEGTYVVGYEVPQGWHQTGPVGAVIPPDTSDPDGLNVHLHSRVSIAQFADGSTAANDVTSYVSPSGREYAIIGLRNSSGFVEVTDPANPVIVATITGLDEGGGGGNLVGLQSANLCHPESEGCGGEHGEASVWRDIKAHNGYAYAVTEASGGIQVIDITQIDNGIVTTVDTSGQVGPNTSHNIALNPDSGHVYLAGANTGGQLIAYDLSNPALPQLAGSWSGPYVHDVTVVTYTSGPFAGSELAYAFVGGAGLRVIDVTNKANMHTIGSTTYPNLVYSHSGSLSADRKHLFLNDELDESRSSNVQTTTTYILNIEDPTNPYYVTSFTNGEDAIDHNSMVRGDFLYLSSYLAGLRVYDVTDPLNFVESGYYDTQPTSSGINFGGNWGVDSELPSGTILASDMSRGLFVLDARPASVPHGEYMVEVGTDEVVSNIDFGSQPLDFGDAPSPYPTSIVDSGARHGNTGPSLGLTRDAEPDGQPTTNADGDGADEDGVTFGTIQLGAAMAGINIDLQNASTAQVDAWIDFDGNDSWDASDQILDNVTVGSGLQTINFTVPAGAVAGDTYARIRVSTAGDLETTGFADDGEVEDYLVTILPAPPQVEQVVINGGDATRSKVTSLTVQFDSEVDHTALNSAFTITNITTSTAVGTINVDATVSGGKTTAVLTFDGASTIPPALQMVGIILPTLDAGNYRLDIDADQVLHASNNSVMMATDHEFGGQTAGESNNDDFFAWYGDANGDGSTNFLDFNDSFLPAFGSSISGPTSPSYRADLDLNGDGNVNFIDFNSGLLGKFGTGRP